MNREKKPAGTVFYKFLSQINSVLELCYYLEVSKELSKREMNIVKHFISSAGLNKITQQSKFFQKDVVEIGPKLHYASPWSDQAQRVLKTCGVSIIRLEYSVRHKIPDGITKEEFAKKVNNNVNHKMVYEKPLNSFGESREIEQAVVVDVLNLGAKAFKVYGFNDDDAKWWADFFINVKKRNPTESEVLGVKMGNTEHSNHPYFASPFTIDGKRYPALFSIVKRAYKKNPGNAVCAFFDNASAIGEVFMTIVEPGLSLKQKPKYIPIVIVEKTGLVHISIKVETHNFPSAIEPYHGAVTGGNGMYRDLFALGRAGRMLLSGSVICVGGLSQTGFKVPGEYIPETRPGFIASPNEQVKEVTDGLTRNGNEFGIPNTFGSMLSFEQIIAGEHLAYYKPIVEISGAGFIKKQHLKKLPIKKGMLVLHIGNLTYDFGYGGGLQSSKTQSAESAERDVTAVQRGDGEYQNKSARVLVTCTELDGNNIIVDLTDQGAAGLHNAVKELCASQGCRIDIAKVNLGDKTMSQSHILFAEAQELFVVIIEQNNLKLMQEICARENCNVEVLGEVTGDNNFTVIDSRTNETLIDLPMNAGPKGKKIIKGQSYQRELIREVISSSLTFEDMVRDLNLQFGVASKDWFVHKVDRSVLGLIVLQQLVGSQQIPVADATISRLGYNPKEHDGCILAKGLKPLMGIINPEAMGRMSVMEALLNISCGDFGRIEDLNAYQNVMWAAKSLFENASLYKAVRASSNFIEAIGSRIIGGKDSLSMQVDYLGRPIKSLGTIDITFEGIMSDVRRHVTPAIQRPGESKLLLLDLSGGHARLGGSAFLQSQGQIGNECPDITPELARRGVNLKLQLLHEGLILASHDRVGDGLWQAVSEMCMASNCGVDLIISSKHKMYNYFFAEEAGDIIEFDPQNEERIIDLLEMKNIPYTILGETTKKPEIYISYNGFPLCKIETKKAREYFQKFSYHLEQKQMDKELAKIEYKNSFDGKNWKPYRLNFEVKNVDRSLLNLNRKPKALILREEGSNGDKEMAAMFMYAGFEVVNLPMSDFVRGKIKSLKEFQLIALVGGFANADTFGAGVGWAGILNFHPQIKKMFDDFLKRKDTLVFAVCNGCQMAAVSDWLFPKTLGKVRLLQNESGKFESRSTRLETIPSPSIFTQGMKGSQLYCPSCHGEGKFNFSSRLFKYVIENNLIVFKYVNPKTGETTTEYPYCPNGSPLGIAGITSKNGRFMIMMPHPERTWLIDTDTWKEGYEGKLPPMGPYYNMAVNAYNWCVENRK